MCVTPGILLVDTCYNTSVVVVEKSYIKVNKVILLPFYSLQSEVNLNQRCIDNSKHLICSVRWQISFGFCKLGMCWVMSPAVNSASPTTI